jgi:lactate dehydrogenase-like 2-hydroxyacid dehydrogenase
MQSAGLLFFKDHIMSDTQMQTDKHVDILLLTALPHFVMNGLQAMYELHDNQHITDPGAFGRVRAMVGSDDAKIDAKLLATYPKIEIITIMGTRLDKIDVKAAKSRGIQVTYTPEYAPQDVADMAFGLMLNASRKILQADRFVRNLDWVEGAFPLTKTFSGLRLGLVGFGALGKELAQRASGFNLKVSYHDTESDSSSDVPFVKSLVELASQVDFLVICKTTPAPQAMINQSVLDALGSKGYLINVGHASWVDQAALVKTLQSKRIAGAALDVFPEEPKVSAELRGLYNVLLTPHIACSTQESRMAMGELLLANLHAHFESRPLLTPWPPGL